MGWLLQDARCQAACTCWLYGRCREWDRTAGSLLLCCVAKLVLLLLTAGWGRCLANAAARDRSSWQAVCCCIGDTQTLALASHALKAIQGDVK